MQSTVSSVMRRLDITDRRSLDTAASVPFATRRAPVNRDRTGNGQYLVSSFTAATPLALGHNLNRVPVLWWAVGAGLSQQVPKITVTAVSNTSITVQTDVTSTGVIVFIA